MTDMSWMPWVAGLLPHRVVHVPRPLAKNRSLLLYPLPARM